MKTWTYVLLSIGIWGGCGARSGPCENEPGSCLAVSLQGSGAVDDAQFLAGFKSSQSVKMGALGSPCSLPCRIEVLPPAGTNTADISSVVMHVVKGGAIIRAVTLPPFAWPLGTHVAVGYYLGSVQ